ncbi:transposase [Cronobacter sakazakii]|nr:transposase [Cronobacter sakazakii]ELY5804689.1 transposase [Cronobacter sakazakii]ELY5855581.1 transposase [Cronobacter malonaticus]
MEAIKQVVENDHSVSSIATRFASTSHTLYAWVNNTGRNPPIPEGAETGG